MRMVALIMILWETYKCNCGSFGTHFVRVKHRLSISSMSNISVGGYQSRITLSVCLVPFWLSFYTRIPKNEKWMIQNWACLGHYLQGLSLHSAGTVLVYTTGTNKAKPHCFCWCVNGPTLVSFINDVRLQQEE